MEPLVSICCLAYNHEKYIEDALKGFVNQKTEFPFEVIIHDDASTDGTTDIIRRYEKLYPEIIKPIYQEENQYRKHISIQKTYNYPRCKGKYIALCEGDDYWCDENKLQKQVEYMEKNPECTFCFSNGYIQNQDDGTVRDFLPYTETEVDIAKDSKQLNLGEIIDFSFVPYASFFFRRETLENLPTTYQKRCPAGDLKTRLFLTGAGYAFYFADKMVVYRENVPNSAMTRWKKENKKSQFSRSEKIVNMIRDVDDYTNGEYRSKLTKLMDIHVKGMLSHAENRHILKDEDCYRLYKQFSFLKKCKFHIKCIVPEKIIKGR